MGRDIHTSFDRGSAGVIARVLQDFALLNPLILFTQYIFLGERKLHESTDHVTASGESLEKNEVKPAVPLKRKIGTISAAGPTYKGTAK